ncbi:DUF5615 family PIN-like protein [Neolewinella agarilytica]|uniref:DUF5615 family PIN-like protein n=1 Tax=Neolewinella agarilytica TaxID=478744 RepID=UPI0023543821|nr:DUF5615 family PIN-like protein [Neolewinella agarilytica]
MKFFIDAQLPRQITATFTELGHQAIHARELPDGNDTKDEEIVEILDIDIVIVSKDSDFFILP